MSASGLFGLLVELLVDAGFLVGHGVAALADVFTHVHLVPFVAHAELALHRNALKKGQIDHNDIHQQQHQKLQQAFCFRVKQNDDGVIQISGTMSSAKV